MQTSNQEEFIINRKSENDVSKRLQNIQLRTYPVPFDLGEIKDNLSISTNAPSKPSKEQLINQAFKSHSQGKISEAAKFYQYFLNQGFTDPNVFSNYGAICQEQNQTDKAIYLFKKSISLFPNSPNAYSNLGSVLKDLGKLDEAEILTRKAIELNENDHISHNNLGSVLKDLGELEEAEISTRKAIELNPDFANSHYNLGTILIGLDKLKEAEISTRKAIELDPFFAKAYSNLGGILNDLNNSGEAEIFARKSLRLDASLAEAHYNLGCILKDLGKEKEAEKSIRKAIEINPDFSKPYYTLSTLNNYNGDRKWQKILFTKNILKKKSKKDLVNFYFARANIMDAKHDYSKASILYEKANRINISLYGSNYSSIKLKIDQLYKNWGENENEVNLIDTLPIPIFIVGMPRSGKTITESILARNNKVEKLGESNELEHSIKYFLDKKENILNQGLYKIYINNIKKISLGKFFISTTTPMNLIYTGLIASQINTAKIIYCYRNPLDNIKEIYKKNMESKHTYSCSIDESANLWMEIHSLMKKYKKRYKSTIYFLDYDNLVTNTEEAIEDLISWLGWQSDNKYLEPILDPKTIKISNRLNPEVINKNELYSWKNYRDLLMPAIKIFNNNTKYKYLVKK